MGIAKGGGGVNVGRRVEVGTIWKCRHKGRVERGCLQGCRRGRRFHDREQGIGRRESYICGIYPGSSAWGIRKFDLDPFSGRGTPNCGCRPADRQGTNDGIIKRTRPGAHIDRLDICYGNIRPSRPRCVAVGEEWQYPTVEPPPGSEQTQEHMVIKPKIRKIQVPTLNKTQCVAT